MMQSPAVSRNVSHARMTEAPKEGPVLVRHAYKTPQFGGFCKFEVSEKYNAALQHDNIQPFPAKRT